MVFMTDWGHLVIDDYGVFVGKRHGRVVIYSRGGLKEEFPVKRLRMVVITGKVGIGSDLLRYLADCGVDVLITSSTGRPVALMVHARCGGTVRNRVEQYKSLEDGRACRLAGMIISAKLSNQASNMKYYSKARSSSGSISRELYEKGERIKELKNSLDNMPDKNLEKCRETVMSIEAQAANIYWEGMKTVLGPYGFKERLQRRDKVREIDIANLSLNIMYNNLAGTIWKYVLRFSLDPFQGFLHARRSGKLSLVFDLMEPYRPIIDRLVVSFLRRISGKELKKMRRSELARRLTSYYYDALSRNRITYRGRSTCIEATIFWYVQSIVSYLTGRASVIHPPYNPW